MGKKLLLMIAILFSANASATLYGGTSTIDKILMFEDAGLVYVYPAEAVKNAPACHGSNGNYISFSMSRPMAKEYLSVLLSAFIAQKSVSFRIYENCRDQSVSATLAYFTILK